MHDLPDGQTMDHVPLPTDLRGAELAAFGARPLATFEAAMRVRRRQRRRAELLAAARLIAAVLTVAGFIAIAAAVIYQAGFHQGYAMAEAARP